MIHLYENHLGGYYITDEYNEHFLETCEMCGDSDWYVGRYDTMEEVALELFKRDTSDEHIKAITGLKVNVSFEESDE